MIRKNKILLVAPYSETLVGGISTWTKNILDYCNTLPAINVYFLNTAFSFKPNIFRNNLFRKIYGIFDSFLILVLFIYKLLTLKPSSVHYTSSASYALYKDLLALKVCKYLKIKFIIHWRFGRIPELFRLKNKEWNLLCSVLRQADISIVIDLNSYEILLENSYFKIVYIPNPISIELQNYAENIHTEKKLKDGKIIFVGHIIKSKGVYELVEACSTISSVKELVMVGPVIKNVKDELTILAKKRNDGHWLKWRGKCNRQEVYNEMLTAYCLCLPSYTEGFPNVIIEAMINKCAIIATDVGAIPEMLVPVNTQSAGICIQSRRTDQLHDAINILIENKKLVLEMGENGYQRVLANYTLEAIFPKYMEVWTN